MLARWPVPFEPLTLPTRHGPTFVIASGEAGKPPLVLLHGSASNAVSWLGDVTEYSRHFRVYAVDLPGEPGRSAHTRPEWQGPAFAEWLEDVLDGLGVPKAALLGLSQGGWTALKFAIAMPERVTQLVLLAPGGVVQARTSFIVRAVPLSLLGRRGAEAIVRITLGGQPVHEDAVRFMNLIMTHFRPRIGVLPLFSDEELSGLNMPVLLILGARDPITDSVKTALRMGRLLQHLKVSLLPDTGHVLVGLAGDIAPIVTAQGV